MRARTWMAGLAAAALAAAGLVGAGTAADAAITTQPAGVSVTVDATSSNSALVSRSVVANLTVKNNSAASTLGIFTVVVPSGAIGPVTAVGVNGNGNWRQTVLPCGTTANCSALVLVYASLPLSSSVLRPGQSVTSSIKFTTPSAPTSLAFKFLGIGNGLFTTTDVPTISVVNGVAGSYCVNAADASDVTAGGSKTFTVQAISDGSGCGGLATGKATGIAETTLTAKFSTDDSRGSITSADAAAAPNSSGSTVVFTLPSSTTGLYTFTGHFTTATAAQSFDVSSGTAPTIASGSFGPFAVVPAAPVSVVVTSVANANISLPSPVVGTVFVTTYQVYDVFHNYILTAPENVAIAISGTGIFTVTGGHAPVAAASNGSNPKDGTVEGTFSEAGARTLTATVGGVPSSGFPVTFASAILSPNTAATVATTGFSTVGGAPSCTTGTTCAALDLSLGGSGAATFVIDTCANTGIAPVDCGVNTAPAKVADFTGSLYNGAPVPANAIYGPTNAAHLTYVCTKARCPHRPSEGATEFTDSNTWEESVEDFTDYKFRYSTSNDPTVRTAPACQLGELEEHHPRASVTNVPAGANSCVDVTNLVRTAAGDLVFSVWFYDDYKGFVG